MNPVIIDASFDLAYVALSFLISAVGAFVALTAARGILAAGRPVSRINLLAAGLALGGIGIWAMHFIGMLALRMDMGIGYAMTETLVSLLLAVGGSALALRWVARDPYSLPNLATGGALLGLAVCLMHYVGMYGMRFGGLFDWSAGLVAASVAIAWLASTAALLLAFMVRGVTARAAAALVMAGAVCAMHYTGMAAATFICTSPTPGAIPQGFAVVSAMDLPMLVAVLAFGMAFVISVDQVFQHVGRNPARLRPDRDAGASR